MNSIITAYSRLLLLTASSFFTATLTFIPCAFAHGVAGNREFPSTLTFDDPGISDEATLPQVNMLKDKGGHWNTDYEAEYDKTITDDLVLNVGGDYVDDHDAAGWDNISLGAKYKLFVSDEHEAMVSFGFDWDIGNSGSKKIGDDFSTLTPSLVFGKGFGDLPDDLLYLKPLALTGALGVAFPTDRHTDDERNPDMLEWDFALQYSLPYLQEHVKDVGLPEFVGQLTPVVEFAFETPFGPADTQTTGTINPGILWSNGKVQVGAEAIVPVNNDSGQGVGARVQLHFFLDDIFPNSIGKPIW